MENISSMHKEKMWSLVSCLQSHFYSKAIQCGSYFNLNLSSAGIRTPQPIRKMKEVLPAAYEQFLDNVEKLEHYFKDMQDVEFTVEKGKLWMLQCRNGKRTGVAALKIAIDLVNEGICTKSEALLKVEPTHVEQLLHPCFSEDALKSDAYTKGVVAKGLPGSPGGTLAFSICKDRLVFTAPNFFNFSNLPLSSRCRKVGVHPKTGRRHESKRRKCHSCERDYKPRRCWRHVGSCWDIDCKGRYDL